MRNIATLAIAALAVAGCMSQVDLGVVEASAARFFERQTRGDDQGIYDSAAQGFRDGARLEDLARLNSVVRSLSGCTTPARDPSTWNNTMNTSGHFITVVYNRTCDSGPVAETFVFQIIGGQAALFNYHVQGMGLFAPPPAAPAATPEAAPQPTAPAPDETAAAPT